MSNSSVSRLDELIGLDSAKRVFRPMATGQSNVHAALFYGATGSGKGILAELLAQSWLCKAPSEAGADGDCRACGAFLRGNNADFLRVVPDGASRIIKVGFISNDSPKDDEPIPIITFFRSFPLMSRHKVALIESADRMNSAASNALLKTLEEPHPHAKLILTTDTIGGILPTILSRCLAVACEAPTDEALTTIFPDSTVEERLLSEGTPGRLAQILRHRTVYGNIARFAASLMHRRPGEALIASEELRKLSEALDKALKCGARTANAEALQALAICLARNPDVPPEWTQYVAEVHRRIVWNGQAGILFDGLFAKMLSGYGR